MQWGGHSRVPSSGLYAAYPPIPRPQLYVVAVHHLGGFSKGFLIILAGYGRRDAFNVIVPRQHIKPILWHVDLLSFLPKGRSTPNLIFSLFGCCKILREKILPVAPAGTISSFGSNTPHAVTQPSTTCNCWVFAGA
jgi:hypothetical protein